MPKPNLRIAGGTEVQSSKPQPQTEAPLGEDYLDPSEITSLQEMWFDNHQPETSQNSWD